MCWKCWRTLWGSFSEIIYYSSSAVLNSSGDIILHNRAFDQTVWSLWQAEKISSHWGMWLWQLLIWNNWQKAKLNKLKLLIFFSVLKDKVVTLFFSCQQILWNHPNHPTNKYSECSQSPKTFQSPVSTNLVVVQKLLKSHQWATLLYW